MFVYRWEDCDDSATKCAPIAEADHRTYEVAPSDLGHTIRVQETGLNAGGTSTASSGHVLVTPSRAMISASLRSQVAPPGRLARLPQLLKHGGIELRFKALTAGQLLIRWYYLPTGAHLTSGKRKPLMVATGKIHFANATTKRLHIKLTANGAQLLRRSKQLKLTAKGTFIPAGTHAIDALRAFTITR